MQIRECAAADAQQFKILIETIDAETDYMLYSQNERNWDLHKVKKMIDSFHSDCNSALIISEAEGHLSGYIMAMGGKAQKNKHSAYLALGVSQVFAGQGIGTRLMTYIEEWAEKHNISRLELTTMVHNEHALALYKKMGYEAEGVKRQSLKVNGASIDEYYFAKLLNDGQEN